MGRFEGLRALLDVQVADAFVLGSTVYSTRRYRRLPAIDNGNKGETIERDCLNVVACSHADRGRFRADFMTVAGVARVGSRVLCKNVATGSLALRSVEWSTNF